MAGTDDAGDRRDGRRRGVLDKRLDKLRSEGCGVETTGGARARRGVVCWFRRVDVPDPNVVISGGAGMSLMLAGL